MEDKKLTISPNKVLPEALDFEVLRAKGLKHLEELASKIWTDYNTHDPGITMLEVMCYALTDIAYRTRFSMPDLLSYTEIETPDEDTLFNPSEILTTRPVTVLDYRKLFIDIPGVQNAWLQQKTFETPSYYIDKENEVLTHSITETGGTLHGLYNVFLELESHQEWGDLNSAALFYTIAEKQLAGVEIELRCDFNLVANDLVWQENALNSVSFSAIKLEGKELAGNVKVLFENNLGQPYESAFRVTFSSAENLTEARVKTALGEVNERSVFGTYFGKQKAIMLVVKQVCEKYNSNRNLCEDLFLIERAGSEELGVCFDIEAEETADLELLEANIWFAIDQYLNPRVHFYSLSQMREKSTLTEEIFEGPLLQNGFVLDQELIDSEMRSKVYASDIINLIMDMEGVQNLTNFSFSKYDKWGKPIGKTEKWELSISPGNKPLLAKNKSKIFFLKNGVPFVTRKSETRELYDFLKLSEATYRIKEEVENPPLGANRKLLSFVPLAHDLPQIYGVNKDGLPPTATQERQNAALQLKGFLLMFDQILGNAQAQLNGFKKWVSVNPDLDESYFTKFIDEVEGFDKLYDNVANFQLNLHDLAENETTFLERRNRILDHLLARFNEVIKNGILNQLLGAKDKIELLQDSITDKINYLKDLPDLSYNRSGAINQIQGQLASGWSSKFLRSIGVAKAEESGIALKPVFVEKDNGGVLEVKIEWQNRESGDKIFASNSKYNSIEEAELANEVLFETAVEHSFSIVEAGSKWRAAIVLEEHKISSSKMFATQEEAAIFIESIDLQIQHISESMVVFENILARPHNANFNFIVDCIDASSLDCCPIDPYSFRVHVILPFWPERFRKMAYRRYIETEIRKQLPAHIFAKICWVHWYNYIKIEDAFQAWLKARSEHCWNAASLYQKMNVLISHLVASQSVYPEAILHDCEDDQDENPVILDNSKLGRF